MFTPHDIGAYQGKEIVVYVWLGSNPYSVKAQIRGAQNFNATEERPETKVSELGVDATKTVYGSANYSLSVTMIVRDLVQIARMGGLDPATSTRVLVTDFTPVNLICWYKDPDDNTTINMSKYVGGFKSRTSSLPAATDANATITLEGGADLVVMFDGKAECIQWTGDGTTKEFDVKDTDVNSSSDILLVESPAGMVNTDWTFDSTSSITPEEGSIIFNTAPADNDVVRIVYKVS
jgi:hypothetical protein